MEDEVPGLQNHPPDTHLVNSVQVSFIPNHLSTHSFLTFFAPLFEPSDFNILVQSLSFNCIGCGITDGFKEIISKKQWETWVRTMYKRKGKKVHPRNIPLADGKTPGGGLNRELKQWKIGDDLVGTGCGKEVPRGSRLTPERLKKMHIGDGFLTSEERQLFVDILFEYEGAIAFDDTEMGRLKPEIEPPIEIRTVPHDPWQQTNLRLPKAMQEMANEIIRKNLAAGNYEFSQGPYRGRYFLVEKKQAGTFRLVNDIQPLNAVTIRDSGMPPSVDEFSEDFAGYPITSSIDYYSGYYQIPLADTSRDLTAFATLFGLLRTTVIPQGWTNSVAVFQRIMGKVHWRLIPHYARPFLDDIGLKGPQTRYDDVEICPGVRRFVFEHALIFRQFLRDAWLAGLTISGKKSCIAMPGIEIVGFICDANGRHPESRKVQKILDWPQPQSLKEARGFIGTAGYYRMFIFNFSIVAAPIYNLFRKGQLFRWSSECQLAMDILKSALTSAPVLISLDFSPSALSIILQIDASTTIGWGGVLSQFQSDGKLHPARFESGIWSDVEKKQDPLKLECRALLKSLKKFRFWLYGRYFIVETDSNSLMWMLNQPPNDLPNAMMTRWLSYIHLFDFSVRHIDGNKNGAADGLSRRGQSENDEEEEDPDEYFEAKLGNYFIRNVSIGHGQNPVFDQSHVYVDSEKEMKASLMRIYFNEAEYEGEDLILGKYLTSLERPDGLSENQFQQLRKKSKSFFVRDGHLFKRNTKRGLPPRRVIGKQDERIQIIKELHDEIGHRGRKTTYRQIAKRYQWKGMWSDVEAWIKTCEICQKRSNSRYEEPLHPTWSMIVWEKIGLDVVYLPEVNGYGFIVFARDDLSGWVEGRAIKQANSLQVSRFIYEDVICRHGCPWKIVLDGGSENMDLTKDLLERYRIKRMDISAYHPQSNGLVERGHAPVINSIAKMCKERKTEDWTQFLSLALWADRISVRESTGYSAFELIYGRECLLPIQFELSSWNVIDWEFVQSREDLILARMKQLDQQTLAQSQAVENLINSRKSSKNYFDEQHSLRPEQQSLKIGDLVLFNSKQQTSRTRSSKLSDRWSGPYRIIELPEDSTFYRLEELDGVRLTESFAGNRLRKFFTREDFLQAEGRRERLRENIAQGLRELEERERVRLGDRR